MKKLFIVLAVASLGFVACNNEASTEVNPDSATTVTPVEVPVAPTTDSLHSDSLNAKSDSLKVDSLKK